MELACVRIKRVSANYWQFRKQFARFSFEGIMANTNTRLRPFQTKQIFAMQRCIWIYLAESTQAY